MRALIVTPYIYRKEWPEFTRNSTGFGMMVNQIYESVSKEIDVYLLSYVITQGHGNVLKHTWRDVLKNTELKDLCRGIQYFFGYKQKLYSRMKYFYYAIHAGSIRNAIREIKPNVVHIHGIGVVIKPIIEICEEQKIPYIITLHGLIGLDNTIHTEKWDKKMEKDFLIEAERQNIPVSVISTGMKKRIEKKYICHEANNISIICNGTRIDSTNEVDKTTNLRAYYNVASGEKIITVIGTICERENQIQVIRAYKSGLINAQCQIFFCGKDATNGEMEEEIITCNLESKVHVIGFANHDTIASILEQSDLNVIASKEGEHGLSIFEAYFHGVPTVTFTDLDVMENHCDENAVVKVDNRTDQALAEGINFALRKHWDNERIKNISKQFSIECIANEYEKQYEISLADGGVMPIKRTVEYLMIKRMLGYKILTYVGNISENKNQMILAQTMNKLGKEKIIAIFAGKEVDGGELRKSIISNNHFSSVILAGYCEEMDEIWKYTDVNVFLSKNDGFGLPIIEGYVRGIPCLVNKDLDAFDDIYNADCCMETGLEKKEILHKIKEALRKQWDTKKIKSFGQRFGTHNMAEQYISLYKKTDGMCNGRINTKII